MYTELPMTPLEFQRYGSKSKTISLHYGVFFVLHNEVFFALALLLGAMLLSASQYSLSYFIFQTTLLRCSVYAGVIRYYPL